MKNNAIWIIFTKNTPLDGCEIQMDDSEFYFAEIFIPAPSLSNALDQAEQIMLENKLDLCDVTKAVRYLPQEWEHDSPQNRVINQKANDAVTLAKPQVSPFRSEDIQEDMRYQHIATELD